jgi:hypothetical protein
VFVSRTNVTVDPNTGLATGQVSDSSTPFAELVRSETGLFSVPTPDAHTPDMNIGLVEITPSDENGTATAVWEVVNTTRFAIDTLQFGVFVSPNATHVAPGSATVNLMLCADRWHYDRIRGNTAFWYRAGGTSAFASSLPRQRIGTRLRRVDDSAGQRDATARPQSPNPSPGDSAAATFNGRKTNGHCLIPRIPVYKPVADSGYLIRGLASGRGRNNGAPCFKRWLIERHLCRRANFGSVHA